MRKKGNDEKKKGKQTSGVVSSLEMDDLSKRLEEEDFSMVSHFS